jgi:hypothetical protein
MLSLEQLNQAFERMSQQVWEHDQALQPAKQAPLLNVRDAEARYSPTVMAKKLSATGEAPLSLSGLRGSAAEIQSANIPEVNELPQLGDSAVKVGTVVHQNGTVYRRSSTAWVPIGGASSQVQAAVVAGGGGGVSGGGSIGGAGGVYTQYVTVAGASPLPIVPVASPVANTVLEVVVTQDATGYTISWGASFVGITDTTVPTTPLSTSVLHFTPSPSGAFWIFTYGSLGGLI